MALSAVEYQQLRDLITAQNRTEVECQAYLTYAARFLTRHPFAMGYNASHIYEQREHAGTSGRTDYLVCYDIDDQTRRQTRYAYLWEVKAPQCFVFQQDTQNRLVPTADLVSAENQLIYYRHELANSQMMLDRFNVREENVKFGGIIIGRRETRVRADALEPQRLEQLFGEALSLREKYFYQANDIRLFTWDSLSDWLRPDHPQRLNEQVTGTTTVP